MARPLKCFSGSAWASPFREKRRRLGSNGYIQEIRSDEIRKNAFSLKTGEVSKPFVVELLNGKLMVRLVSQGKPQSTF